MKIHEEDKLLPGEKIMGIGFLTVMIMGSGLDSPDWMIPFIGVISGMLILLAGKAIAKKEGSEYV